MKHCFVLAVPLITLSIGAYAQTAVLTVPGQAIQGLGFGVQMNENSLSLMTLPTIDTRNRPVCRRQVDIKTLDLVVQCQLLNSGAIDPGCRIDLALELGDDDGGHKHTANRTLGTLNHATDFGTIEFTYTVPEVAGAVNIVARGVGSNGASIAPFTFHVDIGKDDLQELPAGTDYRRVGDAGDHPDRFWGTPELNGALISLAKTYHTKYPDHTLGYNDMNLPYGGLFDFKSTWSEPHCGHRGDSADLRTNDIPKARRDSLKLMIAKKGLDLHDETDTKFPHYHLTR